MRKRILIVDDEEINRMTLEAGLLDLYEIVQADSGMSAIKMIEQNRNFALVLLDLSMPNMNGITFLNVLNRSGIIKKLPVFVITGNYNEKVLLEAYDLGATDVVTKPYNIQFLRKRISNIIELYQQRYDLEEIVAEKSAELVKQNKRLVEAMANIVEFRSEESGTHVRKVRGYTKILMDELVASFREYDYLKDDVDTIAFAATLHDIGKISIPDSILNKKTELTEEEYSLMKSHTTRGYEQIKKMKDIMDPTLYKYSLDIVYHHHERFDGKGYPEGLRGQDISIWSQVVALSDVYDALTSERCYKKAIDHATAVQMILSGECGIFNPQILEVFKKTSDKCNQFRIAVEEN